MQPVLSEPTRAALAACIAKRGKNKGQLLAQCPSPFTQPLAYAAWQGAQMVCNPFKVSIVGQILMTRRPDEMAVYQEVKSLFEAHPELRHLDRDRSALERLGVW